MPENMWKNRRFLVYFFLLYIANWAAMAASVSIFLSTVSLDLLHAGKLFIGFIVALPRYTVIFLSVLIFRYADKINKQTLITWGSIVGVLSFIGLAYSKGYVTLIFFCLLYGCAYMVALNYITVMLLDYTPIRQRASVLGIFATSSSLGYFFGPFLTRSILDAVLANKPTSVSFPHLTWFGMFSPKAANNDPNLMFFAGVIYYAIVGIFLVLAARTSGRLPLAEAAPAPRVLKKEKKEGLFKGLFIDYSDLAILDIFLGAMWTGLFTFVPSFDNALGLGESGYFFLGFSVLGLLGRMFLAPQLGRWRVGMVVSIGLYIYVSCFCLVGIFGIFPSWWLLLIVGSLHGLTHGVLYPSTNILFTHKVPNQTSRSTLAFVVMFQIGSLFNIPLGELVDILGHEITFWIAFVFFAAICVWLLRRKSLQDFFLRVDANMKVG